MVVAAYWTAQLQATLRERYHRYPYLPEEDPRDRKATWFSYRHTAKHCSGWNLYPGSQIPELIPLFILSLSLRQAHFDIFSIVQGPRAWKPCFGLKNLSFIKECTGTKWFNSKAKKNLNFNLNKTKERKPNRSAVCLLPFLVPNHTMANSPLTLLDIGWYLDWKTHFSCPHLPYQSSVRELYFSNDIKTPGGDTAWHHSWKSL